MKTHALKWAIAGLALIGTFISSNLEVSVSNSVDKRVFWKTSSIPKRGDYGTFRYPANEYLESRGVDEPFTKVVACAEGDLLEYMNQNFYCNGKYLGTQLEADSEGTPLPKFEFTGVIPENKAFMLGHNPYSGDSRYLGLVDIRTVRKVIPLW